MALVHRELSLSWLTNHQKRSTLRHRGPDCTSFSRRLCDPKMAMKYSQPGLDCKSRTPVCLTGFIRNWSIILNNIRLMETRGLRLPDEPQKGRNHSWVVDEFSAPLELLTRLPKTLQRPTTGFAFLEAHQPIDKYTHLQIDLVFTRDSTESLVYDVLQMNVLHIGTIFEISHYIFIKKTTYKRARWPKWLEREFADRKVRGSNPTSASRIPLSLLGQPDSIPALVQPSGGMAVRHQNGATVERCFYPSLDGSSPDAEVGFVPLTFGSISSRLNHVSHEEYYCQHFFRKDLVLVFGLSSTENKFVVRTRPLPLEIPYLGLGDLVVSQPSCLLRVAWQLGTERVLQLDEVTWISFPYTTYRQTTECAALGHLIFQSLRYSRYHDACILFKPKLMIFEKYTHLQINLVFMRDSTESLVYAVLQLNALHTGRRMF
ncbi:hypothetical protein T265_07979 [Opisthorchis viverrini]|uniref:Uncharacterized protein n=1 Tax=Opisthorchis viverrini TaxID=6198 RepID=A0A074ZLV1_OPIVI|nr:hypothetical protein T265_07979 [Opisthorchis viverrini]KER24340.1 hypothetical protein T265_07979 [Opisthorchis viverrini]